MNSFTQNQVTHKTSSKFSSYVQNEITESVAALSGNVANRLLQSSRKEWIESTAERAAKKIRLEDAAEFSFKKPGLKNQHKNRAAVLTAIEDAIESLNNDDVETAKSVLEQGKKDVLHRIKLLRIADRNGWGVVKIYEQDPIAEDAEDERRIKKAIKQAEVEKGISAKNGDFVKRPLRKFSHRKSNYTNFNRQNFFNKRRCYN